MHDVAADRVVGRELEMAEVSAFVDARPTTRGPAALVLEGEPGIGKTTIVQAVLDRARDAGLRVWHARPAVGESELPYAGLGDLLAALDSTAIAALPGPQAAAIEAALYRAASGAEFEAPALSRGLLELLRLEGSSDDLLLVVDDVQWLDRPTVSALTFALRRLGPVPLRLLAARRTEEEGTAALPFALGDWEYAQRLVLGPLSATELGAVIRGRLGMSLPRPRLQALRRDSGGNPMFALELVQRDPNGEGAGRSATLPAALAERLRLLEDETRGALSFAAAALRPSFDLLLRAGVERTSLRAALSTGMVVLDGERLSFAHPLLGASVYELLLPDERREIHLRLATGSPDRIERAHHLCLSALPPDEAAARELESAAEEAARLGDPAGAAAFLLRAAELSAVPDGDTASLRLLQAANKYVLAGDVAAGAALSRRLNDRLPPGPTRARARQTLTYCTVGAGQSYSDCVHELELALEDAGSDEALQAELNIDLTEISLGMCRLEDAVRCSLRAIELGARTGRTDLAVSGRAALGFAESMLGRGVTRNARAALEEWDESFGFANTPRMALACSCIAALAFDEAEDLLELEMRTAAERGLEPFEVIARGHLAEVQGRAGRWDEALVNARMALEHARQATEPQAVTGASSILALTEALLGQLEQARTRAAEALPDAEEAHDFWFIISHRSVLGFVALTAERPEEAVRALEPAWTLMLERRLGDLSLFPVGPLLGEALIELGRVAEALAVADRLADAPEGAQPWCRAMALRLQALAAAARGEHDAAEDAIAEALEIQRGLPEPFEYARTLHIRGRLERSSRRWGVARGVLAEALELFDRLGAARWAEKASADIARLPGRRPGDGRTLTMRERDVAELVARGLANKEIAARLHVSISTVERTVTKVYAKLGVHSRAELATRSANLDGFPQLKAHGRTP